MSDNRLVLDIHADYEIAPHMVVFSHGFGVERTARGMFSEIVKSLPVDYGYVMFDYYDIDGKTINISTFEDQQRMLLSIIAWLSEQADVTDISLVSHSAGCVVSALSQPPEVKSAVMLAPPVQISGFSAYFKAKLGVVKQDDLWIVPRSDGTTSYIPAAMFAEIEDIDALQALLNYAAVQPYALLIPAHDEVLGAVDYNDLALDENVTAQTIDGADHNFTGSSRALMIEAVVDWLTS